MIKNSWKQWKRKWAPYALAYGGKFAMRLLLRTCKIKIDGLDSFVSIAKSSPCILMLWHSKLVIVSEIMSKHTSNIIFRAFISKSRDGDALAILTKSYPIGRVLRVPHNTRHRALNQMIGTLKEAKEVILITPDGPRGPKHQVKPGIVMAARESAAAIVPFSWNCSRYWQLSTWDQMKIPKPFTTIHVAFGAAVALSEDISEEKEGNLEGDAKVLRDALLELEKKLEYS